MLVLCNLLGIENSRAQLGVLVQPPNGTAVPLAGDSNGGIVTTAPLTSGITATSVTCGTTSTALPTGITYLHINVPPTVTQSVCFAWNGNTATMTPPSECYSPPVDLTWGGGTGSCIVASGSANITVITK